MSKFHESGDKITVMLKYPILKDGTKPKEVHLIFIDNGGGMTAEEFRQALIDFMVSAEDQGDKLFNNEFDNTVNLQ